MIPHQDAHNSEYLSASDERVAFISGFDGSAGTCVVTANEALLWTDGRYFNQALNQLSSEWTLMKDRLPETPKISEWLGTHQKLNEQNLVGIDPFLTAVATRDELVGKQVLLKSIPENLVDAVWGLERPTRSLAHVMELAIEYTGQARGDKLTVLREEIAKECTKMMLVCSLDEVAWVTNLRGTDIDYNPLFFAYLAITETECVLFTEPGKVTNAIAASLKTDGVTVRPYTDFLKYVSGKGKTWIDPDTANLAVYEAIGTSEKVEKALPIALLKSIKNSTEIAGARACHIRDGAAETKWLHWLSTEVMPNESVWKHHTEVTLADKLEDFRKEAELFQGLSFPSISSFGPNAAVIHYHARTDTCAHADPKQIFLMDSGGQYLDGTTDVTRTVHFGTPTVAEIDAFTRVLKGVIALTSVKFPPGTVGPALDVLARSSLWEAGLDFRHGTGHGVGAYLCVHEGPQGIGPPMFSARSTSLRTGLKPGMILSNEPGYYEDGAFGIRIENLMTVVETETPFLMKQGEKMLTFDTLTMIPIQKSLIDITLLNTKEIEWVNRYHATVREKVSPCMNKQQAEWLNQETSPLTETPAKKRSKV